MGRYINGLDNQWEESGWQAAGVAKLHVIFSVTNANCLA